jgi:hypothetical protein
MQWDKTSDSTSISIHGRTFLLDAAAQKPAPSNPTHAPSEKQSTKPRIAVVISSLSLQTFPFVASTQTAESVSVNVPPHQSIRDYQQERRWTNVGYPTLLPDRQSRPRTFLDETLEDEPEPHE